MTSLFASTPYPHLYALGYRNFDTMESAEVYDTAYEKELDETLKGIENYDLEEERLLAIVKYVINHSEPATVQTDKVKQVDCNESSFMERSVSFQDTGYSVLHDQFGTSLAYARVLYGLLKRAGFDVLPVTNSLGGTGSVMVRIDKDYLIDAYQADIDSMEIKEISDFPQYEQQMDEGNLLIGYTGLQLKDFK